MKNNLQNGLFDFIQNNLIPNQNLSAWLCDAFNIDTSSAYRRIRGDKELSISELEKLSELLPGTRSYIQNYFKAENDFCGKLTYYNDWHSLRHYYLGILENLRQAVKVEHNLNYVARDLPFFSFYGNRDLMRYKLNVWARCGGFPMQSEPPEELLNLGEAIFEVYKKLNTTEIWYIGGIHNQISQLKFWYEMDYIEKEEFKKISDGFCEVMEQYERWLENQEKPGGGQFNILTTDLCIMNNGGLLTSGENQLLMNGFQGTHIINSTDKTAIRIFKEHGDSHLKVSTSIGGTNSKSRYLFFKDFKTRISESIG